MWCTSILVMLVISSLSIVTAEHEPVFTKHQEFTDSKVSGALSGPVVGYSACHGIETSADGKRSRMCSITNGNMADKSELASCNITFQGKLTNNYTMHVISPDRMVVVWCDDDWHKKEILLHYTFVHLPDCQTVDTQVAFDDHETLSENIAGYGEAFVFNEDGTYDVFFESQTHCGHKVCRMTIDNTGKIIKEPTGAYRPNKDSVVLTENRSVNNSVVLAEMGSKSGDTRIAMITSDGLKVLREFKNFEFTDNDASVGHGMIRFCSRNDALVVECEIYDSTGKSLSKSAIDVGDQEFSKLGLTNMPNGEFVLLTRHEQNSNITKYDANNKRLGTVQLPLDTCDEDLMVTLDDLYRENNKNCLSRICYDDNHVDSMKHCYDDGDFK